MFLDIIIPALLITLLINSKEIAKGIVWEIKNFKKNQ